MHRRHRPLGTILDPGNHLLDLGGRLLGTVGEGAHLIGHHGKATARLAGAGRFDGGIQRQQVGLPGNRANHVQHAADLVGIVGQLFDLGRGTGHVSHQMLDGRQRLVDPVAAITGGLVGALRGIGGADGIVRHFLDRRSHLVDGGGRLVDLRALLVQAAAGVFGDGVQFLRSGSQLVGRGGDLADGVAQAALHAAQGAQQQGWLVAADYTDVLGQVAGRHAFGHAHRIGQRHDDTASEHGGNGDQGQHDHQQRDNDRGERFVSHVAAELRGLFGTFAVVGDQRRHGLHHAVGAQGQGAVDLLPGVFHAASNNVLQYACLQLEVLLVRAIEGVEQGAVIGGGDGTFVCLQAILHLGIGAVEQLQVAAAFAGVVVQCGTQGEGAGAAKVAADFAQGHHGGHPVDPDFVRGLVHLPGFIKCGKAHEQDQDTQQGEHAGSANADLQIP
ncbi:hypothetical protein D3C81_319910 [compost metagenome]